MPPYELPKEKTKSTTKSMSSLNGGGFNELRFEDKKGHEQIFVHAERDLDHRVEFDARYWTGHDSHTIVEQDTLVETKRDRHETIARDAVTKIGRDLHLSINGKTAVSVDGSFSLNVSGSTIENHGGNHNESTVGVHSLRGGMLVIEGVGGISLRSGASFITITPAGIAIVGPIIQSMPPIIPGGGAPLAAPSGQIVNPAQPRTADIADDAIPGIVATTPTHDPKKSKEKTSWIEIKLIDEETNEPIAGEPYKVTLTDGATLAEGTLDEKGEARVENIDPGNCVVTFPEREREAWKKA